MTRYMTQLLVALVSLFALAVPARASKDIERLQIQIAALQGQVADAKRVTDDALREVRRLSELLAEQNATLTKAIQDQKAQDEAIQATLKDLTERFAELDSHRTSAVSASAPGAPGSADAADSAAGAPPPKELYSQAYADYARGNYDLAIQGFQEYLKNYPNTDFSDNAQYWIGECHYGKQRYTEAIEVWNVLLRDYPSSDKLPDARVKKGMALERLGRRSQALLEYRFVVDRYPNSPAARVARDKLNPQ